MTYSISWSIKPYLPDHTFFDLLNVVRFLYIFVIGADTVQILCGE